MSDPDLTISIFEQHVLLTILRLNPDGYGVSIRDELEKRTNRKVSFGAVYTTLDRLEEKGFVSRREGEATAERGGRKKTYFSLTARGQITLRAALQVMDAMRGGLEIDGVLA